MWTIPNILTITRVAAAPAIAIMVALGGPGWALPAFIFFVLAALTDYLDGWAARRLGQASALGKMLDPIGDKVMVALLLMALADQLVGQWVYIIPAAVILTREILVSGLREFLGDVKLNVTKLAKWKTTAQLVAIAVLLLARVGAAEMQRLDVLAAGLALLWVAALLTAITGWDYFSKGMRHIQAREGER
jgi:cardiolipin synthase